MVGVGLVGIGFMGMTHYQAYKQVRGAKVAAICTRDAKKLAGDWRGIQGNFGPPGEVMDLGRIARYEDWRGVLADPKVDLVDICLPPALHEKVAVAALRAGKHVLCEKPIALEPGAAGRMVDASKKSRKLLMIAQVLPFFGEYAQARAIVLSGKQGRLLGGHFRRIISDPLWIKDFYDPKQVGGPVVDLHIHDAHFIRLLCGMPRAVFSSGRTRAGVVEFLNTQFLYPDGEPSITAASGVIQQQARSFCHGFEIYLEGATLTYDFSVIEGEAKASTPLTIFTADGKSRQLEVAGGDAFVAELTEACKAVRTGKPSALLAGDLAADALTLCHKQTQSVLRGKMVQI